MLLAALLAMAGAPPQVVAVAPLDGLGVDASLVATLNAAVKKKVTDVGLELVAADGSCAGDLACLSASGKKLGATTVVTGSVGLVQDQLHIVLKRVDVTTAKETHSETARVPVDQAEQRMSATALKLLDPQRYNTSGAILVRVSVAGAEVIIDGSPRGITPLLGPIDSLPPGRREIEVRAPGAAEPWRGFVDTPVEGVAQVELSLVEGKLVEGPAPDGPAPTDRGPGVLMLVGGGLGVVGVTATIAGVVCYVDAWITYDRIVNHRETSLKDRNAASTLAAGILVPLGVVGLATGGGLIALEYWE